MSVRKAGLIWLPLGLSAWTALKAAAKKGVRARPVRMIEETTSADLIIERRTLKAVSNFKTKMDAYDEKLSRGFRSKKV